MNWFAARWGLLPAIVVTALVLIAIFAAGFAAPVDAEASTGGQGDDVGVIDAVSTMLDDDAFVSLTDGDAAAVADLDDAALDELCRAMAKVCDDSCLVDVCG
ncbi:MAG: hypothetical protein ABFR89_09800 [Actinomycetota bacterium]